jgi:hypothetical protein
MYTLPLLSASPRLAPQPNPGYVLYMDTSSHFIAYDLIDCLSCSPTLYNSALYMTEIGPRMEPDNLVRTQESLIFDRVSCLMNCAVGRPQRIAPPGRPRGALCSGKIPLFWIIHF